MAPDRLEVPPKGQELLGKHTSDLVSDDTKILESGTVLGTLKYNSSYDGYAKGSKGYYMPVKIGKIGEEVETEVNGTVRKNPFPDDSMLVAKIKDKDTIVKVSVDNGAVATLNFKKATFKREA